MTHPTVPRARTAERSLRRIFGPPMLIALASLVGLVSALVGDGLMDVSGWIGLAVPVAASAWFVFIKKEHS
jgi:hypothetical protein